MEKRTRSPSYPSLSLRDAVEKARLLADGIGQSTTTREVVAKAMGYSGLSGASAGAISAMNKYGLIEGRGEDIRLTDRAMSIVRPLSDQERVTALREAALEPPLFKELADRFKGMNLNQELFRNYLTRNGFSTAGADAAISAYKETLEFVNGLNPVHDSDRTQKVEATTMQQPQTHQSPPTSSTTASSFAVISPPGYREDKADLDEGAAMLILPEKLSPESVADLEHWMEGIFRRLKRRAAQPGASENE